MKSSSQSNSVADSFMTGKLRWSLRLRMIIELAVQRARRSERFAWAQYFTSAACMAYVITLYYSGVGDSRAACHRCWSRVGGALAVFAAYAVGVGSYHRHARRRVRRFLDLRPRFVTAARA
jgi:hypothetical protein